MSGMYHAVVKTRVKSMWTPEKVAEMLELLNKGMSTRMVANTLGITKNSVIGKVHRLGLRGGSFNGWGKKAAEAMVTKKRRHRPRLSMFDMVVRPRPVIKYKEVRLPLTDVPQTHACTIMDLDQGTCHWPLWRDDGEEKFYCGASVDGRTYCADHWRHAINVKREPSAHFVIKNRPA